MKSTNRPRIAIALAMMFCLFLAPLSVYAKKGKKNFNQGIKYENEMKWDLAAQEFALALAQLPSDAEYRLHYQRAMFNASQMFMQQGRTLEEKNDYIGAYNAFRQAYAYDPVNELALAEMDRMVRLQQDKVNGTNNEKKNDKRDANYIKTSATTQNQNGKTQYGDVATEERRVVTYNGDLKAFIKEYAKYLKLNVVFDSASPQFRSGQNRPIEVNLRDVTAAEALDYVFLQESLFFQKIGRRTVIVADQTRRAIYQQLVIRTFYLSNADPEKVRTMLQTIIPAQSGRIQTGVVVDKETNSLTLRDTAENIRLMGELIQNVDKDRPEVVMDVNIYEVSKDKLLQIGNQIGTTDTLTNLGGAYAGALTGDRSAISSIFRAGLGPSVGLVLPPSTISALERKNHAKLLVSTQVHAFNNEESTARIGQRVPVQTASVFPFSNQQINQPPGSNNALGGGFPVINFEPIGLTLKFKPTIFPNKDVQVLMSIESKDVFNANTFTPTFIERTITGTARIQNNRTMMLASVAQDRNSRGRTGIPLLGLIPILGRLFSTPTEDSTKTDFVIAVTPRVLRAPDVTPRDTQEYASGSQQNPTTTTIVRMIKDEDAEEQLAQAQRAKNSNGQAQIKQSQNIPTNVEVEYVPEQKQTNTATSALQQPQIQIPVETQKANSSGAAQTIVPASTQVVLPQLQTNVSEPKTATQDNTAVSTVNSSNQNNTTTTEATLDNSTTARLQPIDAKSAVQDVQLKPASENLDGSEGTDLLKDMPLAEGLKDYANSPTGVDVNMSLEADAQPSGNNKRRIALVMDTNALIGMATLTLRFDPSKISIKGVTASESFVSEKKDQLLIPFITPDGKVILTLNSQSGLKTNGKTIVAYLEAEMLSDAATSLVFDGSNVRLFATDGRQATVRLLEDAIVK